MDTSEQSFQQNMMTSFIQIAFVSLLIFWCFTIIKPFVGMVMWALIIAVALYPLYLTLSDKLGNRPKSAATLLVLIFLAVLLIPTVLLAESSIAGLGNLAKGLTESTLAIPAPNAGVAEWPLVGPAIFEAWSSAAENLQETVVRFAPQLRGVGESVLSFAGSTAITVLVFAFSIMVAGAFMVGGDNGYRVARNIANTLSEEHGKEMIDMSVATIRSVAKGVLGVAVIQSLLAAVGLVAIGVPAPGIWAGIILLLAIMQLPPLLILGPIAVWVFSYAEPVPATIFAVYAFIVSISDSFLKPMFLGRGMDIPMLVILIGAIGGAFTSGIIGLFVGAVVLAVGYKLLMAWIVSEQESHAEPAEEA